MNPDKFYQRTKLFSDILYEIFNVESNYRTELNVLNLKILSKIEEYTDKINLKRSNKLRQSIRTSKNVLFKDNPISRKSTLTINKSKSSKIFCKEEDNPMIDKLMSENLEHLLTFYKTKHKLISKEVSNIGIILYNFSSSHKKYDNYNDLNDLEKYQNDFELNFTKLMKNKKTYFEKMNNLELLFREEESNKKINKQNSINNQNNQNNQNNSNNNNKTNKNNNKNNNDNLDEKIGNIIDLRQKYKKDLIELTRNQKIYITKINEIGNEIQEFNITENNILYNIFKVFEENLISLLKEINNFCLIYEHNKKLISDLNIELGNNLIYDQRIYINYKFEEYSPKFTDINSQIDSSVIKRMNELIGFEFDKIKTNNSINEDNNLTESIMYNKDIDDNLLFILLMDKFIDGKNILNEQEKDLMKNLFNNEKYINEFLKKLNKIRINPKIFNTKKKFDVLLDFFNYIFSKINITKDKSHELVKFLMILSETFKYIEGEKKYFLNNLVKLPDEMKEVQFWIKYIELEIEIEYKKYENKKNIRSEYIVLLSNTTHLKEYKLEKEKIIEIFEYFRKKYKLSNEDINLLKDQVNI